MSAVLGQVDAKPIIGNNWYEAKSFWLNHVLGYEVHAKEVDDYHRSQAPIRIVSAPARTSKSFATAHDMVPMMMPTVPLLDSLHWIVGPEYGTNKEFDYIHELFTDRLEEFQAKSGAMPKVTRAVNNPRQGDMEIVIEHGKDKKGHIKRAVVKGMSGSNERMLQGEQVTTATLSEAAEHKSIIFSKYLQARTWRTTLPTTPKPHAAWIRDMIEAGAKNPALGIEHFTFPRHANPLYDKAAFSRAEAAALESARLKFGPQAKASDWPEFAEQFLGMWVYYTGKALPFSKREHVLSGQVKRRVMEEIELSPKFVSVDYGYEDSAVATFWATLSSGILVIFDEIYERHLTTGVFVEKIRERLEGLDNVSYVTGDPRQPQVAALFERAGLAIFSMDKNAQSNRAAGHRRLCDLLSEGPVIQSGRRFPGLYLTDNCKKHITEWEHLRYREGFRDEYGTTALEGEDHAFDSCRYGVMTLPTPRAPETTEDWIEAEMWKHSPAAERYYFPEIR